MNREKRLLALSTCLVAIACVAGLSATSALAEGNWLVEGKTISESVEVESENDSAEYAFLVPNANFQLVFKKVIYDKGTLLKGGESSYQILFIEGSAYTQTPTKKLLAACKPGDLTFNVKGSLFLHGGKTYERLLPEKAGAPLTITTYSEGCSFGEEVLVTGSLILEDASGTLSNEAVSHLVRQASVALFPEQMKFGLNAMNLDGSWNLKLKGKEGGKKWSGLG